MKIKFNYFLHQHFNLRIAASTWIYLVHFLPLVGSLSQGSRFILKASRTLGSQSGSQLRQCVRQGIENGSYCVDQCKKENGEAVSTRFFIRTFNA